MKELIFNVTKVDNGYILSTPDKLGKQVNRRWYGVIVRRQQPTEISDF